jgi:response regulator of citrate/malate metabolism
MMFQDMDVEIDAARLETDPFLIDPFLGVSRLKEKRHVLVVDDDSMTRAQLKKMVKDSEGDVVCMTAGSLEEALELLRSHEFDLMIADYYLLDNHTGLELWEEASAEFPELECIIISSMGRKEFYALTQDAEVQPLYCQKPIDSKKMKGILRFLLGGL